MGRCLTSIRQRSRDETSSSTRLRWWSYLFMAKLLKDIPLTFKDRQISRRNNTNMNEWYWITYVGNSILRVQFCLYNLCNIRQCSYRSIFGYEEVHWTLRKSNSCKYSSSSEEKTYNQFNSTSAILILFIKLV